jgi:PKD repeat protein
MGATKLFLTLVLGIFLVSSASAVVYPMEVTAEDSSGNLVVADRICINSNCVTDQSSASYLVEEGLNRVIIEDSRYENVDKQEYVVNDFSKTYRLDENSEKYEFTVNVRDKEGNLIKVDKLCLGSDCRNDVGSAVFNVEEGNYQVAIEDGEYENTYDGEFISFDRTKTYSLDPIDQDESAPQASLEVDPQEASVGETVTFDASGSTDNVGITEYRFDLDSDGNIEVRESGEEDGVVNSSFDEERIGAEAEVEVVDAAGKTDSASATYTVREPEPEPANFDVTIDGTNSPVFEGEVLQVDYTVKNNGSSSGTQQIALDINGEQESSEEISLDPDESKDSTLTWSTSVGDAGDYDYTATVSSEDTNDQVQVDVEALEPTVDISDIESSEDVISEGESTIFSADLDANQDLEDVDVRFKSDGYVLDEETVDLDGDNENPVESESLTWSNLENDLDTGEWHELTVEVLDDGQQIGSEMDQMVFYLEESLQPATNFVVSITGVNNPTEGDTLEVEYEVENTGDETGNQDIELDISGEGEKDSESVELDAGDIKDGTLTWDTSVGDAGDYKATVSSDDSRAERDFEVEALEPTVGVSDIESSEEEIGEDGSTIFSADLEANRDLEDIDVLFKADGAMLDEKTGIDLEGGVKQEQSTSLNWNELEEHLEANEWYDLTVEARDNGQLLGSDTKSDAFKLKQRQLECDITAESFDIEPTTVDQDEEVSLSVSVSNDGDSDQRIRVRFSVPGGSATINTDLSSGDSEPYERSLVPEGDGEAQIVVETRGEESVCGESEIGTDSEDITVESPDPMDGSITVNVEDDDGEGLEDATVDLIDSEGDLIDSKDTGSDGEVTFTGLAANQYDVEASKSGYSSDSSSVTLEESDSASATLTLSRLNLPPEANFSYEPEDPEVGDEVSFDASASSDDDGIENYEWDFDDGTDESGSDLENVDHTFEDPGWYEVLLTVSDAEGETDEKDKEIFVRSPTEDVGCGVTEETVIFFLEEEEIYEGESTEAEVNIFNDADQSQEVRVEFQVDGEEVEDETGTVPADESEQFTADISPDEDSDIRAVVETQGGPCGDQEIETDEIELRVLESRDQSLEVYVEDDDGDPLEDAEVDIAREYSYYYDSKDTDDDGEVSFDVRTGDYRLRVSAEDFRTEIRDDITISRGEDEREEFRLERIEGEKGRLEIVVKDQDGDWVEDARVEVDGPEYDVERTNYYGLADFRLEEGRYDVEASHPDYDFDADTSVYVEEDETTSRTLRLDDRQRDALQIVDTDYPSSVCRGDTLSVDVTVENRQDRDEFVTVTGKGLGSINVLNGFILDEDERETKTVRFTNVEGSGDEEFRIQARNGTLDEVEREVDVESCDLPERDARSVSMKLSYPIEPNSALVGDTVKVSGFVDGVQGRSEVTIEVNGDRKARVSTQPDGYYVTFISVDSVGEKSVRAKSGGESVSREIQVLPTASISSLTAPRQVFEGETFEVCTEVNSQVDAALYFYEDGRLLNQVEDKGDRCFEVDASQPGLHTYRLRAATTGESSSATVSVQVLESDVEVDTFPGQLATVESGSGNVKVELYNTHDELKRYDLRLEGLPSTWISQSEKQVLLDSGERKEVFFYLTPRNQGDYDPEVVVEADNQVVYQQKVDLETGGYTEGRDESFLSSLTNLLPF